MWRIRMLLVALGVLTVALSACEQTALNPAWGNGDYEVLALIAE
jgi:hypothetical protein